MSSDRIQLILAILGAVAVACGAVAKVLPPGKAQEVFAFLGSFAKPKPQGLQPENGTPPAPKGDA